MKRSLLSSCLIIACVVAACSPPILKGFYREKTADIENQNLYPVFSSGDSVRRFNMQIDYRKNHLSGMLIIKPIGENTYRVALTSYFGLSIFDFEFGKTGFKIYQCMEELNKKVVINTLKNDFSALFFLNLSQNGNKAIIYRNKSDEALEINKINNYYYLKNNQTKELLGMEAPHFFSSLRYTFSEYEDQFPRVIGIQHTHIGLKLRLDKIK